MIGQLLERALKRSVGSVSGQVSITKGCLVVSLSLKTACAPDTKLLVCLEAFHTLHVCLCILQVYR